MPNFHQNQRPSHGAEFSRGVFQGALGEVADTFKLTSLECIFVCMSPAALLQAFISLDLKHFEKDHFVLKFIDFFWKALWN